MKTKKYIVTCPVCGKVLFKSAESDAELQCYKCHSNLTVEVENGRVTVVEINGTDIGEAERLAAYQKSIGNISAASKTGKN